MANKNWVKGGKSPNPAGRRGVGKRRKTSNEKIRYNLERAWKVCYPAKEIIRMIKGLKNDKERLDYYFKGIEYFTPKQTSLTVGTPFDDLSDNDLDRMLTKILGPVQPANTLQEPLQTQPGQVLFLNPIPEENGTNGQGQ